MNKAILVMALFICNKTNAQTPGIGTWSVLSGKYNINANWSVFFEGQLRSQKLYDHFNYYEYKGGISDNLSKSINVLLGMGHYATYQPDGNFKQPQSGNEFRIWEQLTLTNNIGRIKLEHRYRIEQRFTANEYRNRFRYRLNALYPLNQKTITEKTWYLNIYNEIFLNNDGLNFESNRIYGGLGYQINGQLTLQAGIVNRYDNLGSGNYQSKNFFQTIILFSLNKNKSDRESHPSTLD